MHRKPARDPSGPAPVLYHIDMKKLFVAGACLAVLVSASEPEKTKASAEVVVRSAMATLEVIKTAEASSVSARSYVVFDVTTGEILLEKNADQELPIASVTKLFTAAAALELPLEAEVIVSAADVATEGRAGKLAAGDEYTVHELLFPLLLESSNDAAAALAHMTGQVAVGSHPLADTSGLSDANIASAEELAGAVRELYLTKPHLFDITKLSQKVGEYTGWVNNSPVYDLPGYRGGKHGYTTAAGRTLAAVFAEDALEGRQIGYIILGSADVRHDTEVLRQSVEEFVRLQ